MKAQKAKYTVPNILKAFNGAGDDASISRYGNILLCMFVSPLLIVGSVVNILLRYFVFHRDLTLMLVDSSVFLALGILFEVVMRSHIHAKTATHFVSALFSVLFMYIVIRLYDLIGPSIWTFGVLFIVFATVQPWRIMLDYASATTFLSGVYLTIIGSRTFSLNIYYGILQFVFFALLFIVSFAAYRINIARNEKLKAQLSEVKMQIEKRKIAEEENYRLALYDQLTGLPNRTLFNDRLHQALAVCQRENLDLYVLFLDLDLFKMVNDTMGHTLGDELLMQVGKRLSDIFRDPTDSLARIGGDEFLVMMQDVGTEQQVVRYANYIIHQINKPFIVNERQLNITCSIGISKFPDDGKDVDTMVKHADIAMYKAKEDGKNRYAFYSDSLNQVVQYEMDLMHSLQDALLHQELELYYQPQVNSVTREVIGFEALLRWNHPALGLLLPGKFIAMAERSGLISPIGDWVLRTACMQCKAWQDKGMAKVPIAVNVSANQISSDSFVAVLSQTLLETGLEPSCLELEITERVLIKEMKKIKTELERIKSIGVKLAIDDFGTGFSSMQYLKELPVDRIKIPMEFVHGIDKSVKDESIISVILALAENLNLEVIAEGVETKKQVDFLKTRSCHSIQGFYYCKPMQAGQVEAYCRKASLRMPGPSDLAQCPQTP